MFCSNCGNKISDDSKFCRYCGAPVAAESFGTAAEDVQEPPEAEIPAVPETAEPAKESRIFDEFQWDVRDYPGAGVEKTEDVNFNWDANPADVKDRFTSGLSAGEVEEVAAKVNKGLELSPEDIFPADRKPEPSAGTDRIDKFYTINKKNEEFQALLNREYEKIKQGGALASEMSQAENAASERFRIRKEEPTMEEFLNREGVNRPYEPKPFSSDLLRQIEAQDAEKERERQEKERIRLEIEKAEAERKAKEEARIKAEEEAKARAEEEARLRAAEEARLRAEEEARLKAEEEARRKAEEEARLRAEAEAEARRRAEEEAKLRAEEEAKLRMLQEARMKAEEEARLKAEEEARARAEEEARLKVEAELREAQEAARIRARQEAKLAAEEEARFREEEEKRRRDAELLRARLAEENAAAGAEAERDKAAQEARDCLEQTARIKAEEAEKIKAAVAGFRAAESAAPEEDNEIRQARVETREQINEMARARDSFFAELDRSMQENEARAAEQEQFIPEPVAPVEAEIPQTEVPQPEEDMARTRVIDKKDILAGMEMTRRISKEELRATEDRDFFANLEARAAAQEAAEKVTEAAPEPVQEPEIQEEPADLSTDDFLRQFGDSFEDVGEPEQEEPVIEGFAPKEEPQIMPEAGSDEAVKPGLDNTMVMPESDMGGEDANDFDNFGREEADNYIKQQEMQDAFNGEDEYDEEEESSGKGRVVLKVILVVLIVIFVVELAGIGIKWIAPESAPAQFIDKCLNNVIQLITGEDGNAYTAYDPGYVQLEEQLADMDIDLNGEV